jgi:hypothetical protein
MYFISIILDHEFSAAYYFRALCEKKLNGKREAICSDYRKAIKYQKKGDEIIDSAGLREFCK